MPISKLKAVKTKADLAKEALVLLGVKPADLAATPRIEHLFKGLGGQEAVLEYLAGSEEPEARKICELRARLNVRQAAAVPFEAYCVAAGIPTKRMFGIVAQEVSEQAEKATALLAKAMHPEVVQATINYALMPHGDKDRKMMHLHAGFVPTPKSSMTVFGNVDARQQTQNVAVLPPVEDNVRRLSDRFNSGMVVPSVPLLASGDSGDELLKVIGVAEAGDDD